MKQVVLTVATIVFLNAIAVMAAPKLTQPYLPTPAGQAQADQQAHIQAFVGTITKAGTMFVSREDATTASYQLDDQDTASRFDGKKVKVTGTLDAANGIIRVQSIEAAA